MEREIKFRAFHRNRKAMYWFDIMWGNNGHGNGWIGMVPVGQLQTIKSYRDNMTNIDPTDCEIMQFTGLKDKNGVEIYESDICRILYTDWPSNRNSDMDLEDYLISISYVGKIQYNEPMFEIMLKDRYGDLSGNSLYYGAHGRIEVIGNIHENPELLP